jgi:hypothetical protein
MKEYNFNETIEYIDGTRDLNFEAAQKWAKEHGTTFEEDIDKREPYEQEHEETYINTETGADDVKLVKTPTIKRFFVIGSEHAVETPSEPTEEERKALRIVELQNYLNATDWYAIRFAETGVEIPVEIKAERQSAREEISRLRESGGDNG